MILVDTNILVYTIDRSDAVKFRRARAVFERLCQDRNAALSTQMLSEFANVALRGVSPPVTPDQVYSLIDSFETSCHVLPVTPAVVLEAVRGVRDHRLSYFDAQIWAAARLNQVPVILTEDFNSGATVEGVTFIDPFGGDFEMEGL